PHAAKDGLFVQKFLNAAEVASKMEHPNILPILDYNQQDGIIYRVSHLAELGTVHKHLGWFYDLENANLLLSQIINGLNYIYANGHIHGNMNSSNIYLNSDRHPMLAGFGVSQPPGHAENPYLSPEQIQGGVIDQRADVYALGVMLYELLTGVTPPVGIVVKPSSKRQDLPPVVDQVVLKAMAQNPDQRFQNPIEFRNALQKAIEHPISTSPTVEPPPKQLPEISQSVNVQQSKGPNWLAIILGVILIGMIIGGSILVIPRLLEGDEVAEVTLEPTAEQPTAPAVEEPTNTPIEQPTVEEPTEEVVDPGIELPEGLPNFCYSIVGASGIAVFGITAAVKNHRRDDYYTD
ncbi:MAG: serine/threonine protein kinase, partial [Anaerolineales bacterium]